MKKSTKVLLYGIPSVLLLSCGGGLLGFAHKSRTDRDVALARLAMVGLPTESSLIKHNADPEKDAGALLKQFKSALDSVRKTPIGMAYFDFRRKDVQSRRAFIVANPHLIRMRQKLFTKSVFATQVEPSLAYEEEWPEFGAFRNVITLGIAEAQVLAADGEPVRALQLLKESSKFVQLLHTDNNRFADLLSVSSQSKINRRAALIFSSYGSRSEVRQAMRNFLKESDQKVDFRRSMLDEFSDSIALEKAVQNGKIKLAQLTGSVPLEPDSIWDKAVVSLFNINGVSEMLFGRLYSGYVDLYQAVPSDPTQYPRRIEAAESWDRDMAKYSGPNCLLLQMIVSDYTFSFRQEASSKAEWRTLNALLIASESKSKTGKYPSTLPVTGQDAIDPFTDKPLKYLLKGGKLTIYSVGQDLSDDNGLLFRPTTSSSGGSSSLAQDTGFSIPYDVPARLR